MEEEENQPEENGFSNRHVSTTFIPPLTIKKWFKNFIKKRVIYHSKKLK